MFQLFIEYSNFVLPKKKEHAMKQSIKRSILLFLILVIVIALPLFLLPLNLFSGEIVFNEGLAQTTIKAPLSLSYFIGMGYDEADMMGIKDFYLLPQGYILAVLFIVGIPALISYRIYLKKDKK